MKHGDIPMTVTVTITSDFICPWCLIGERRLEQAITRLPEGVNVQLKWRPFELNPEMPGEGMDRKIYRSLKFGSWERSQQLDAQTVAAARDDAVAFNYASIKRTPSTLLAHRLMALAEENGLATPVAKSVFSAYFEQGRDVGCASILADIAEENGLERESVAAFLASDAGTDQIRASQWAQQAEGIRSVPLFDIEGEIIGGAQSVDTFEAALLKASGKNGDCADGVCTIA
ncbi:MULTISPECIES: DsbA family oxidoreductase [unclassified Rhizobium]|nr:DsbA family oxidoreductase [Rhizobium sp. 16-488-2a]MBO9123732.1 DsbA family oxidoreductase [Rhizobium sp. 16-488-2b]